MNLISASIVLYKSDHLARKTILDFLNTEMPVLLFLIDNSPTDQLKIGLSDLIADKRVCYIFNNKNIGFGAAHNIAMRQVFDNSFYHLVLNPDIFFEPGTLEKLFRFAERDKEIGLVVPKVVYPNGDIQFVCKLLPTPFDLIIRRFLPNYLVKKRKASFELQQSGYDKLFEAPYMHGCFMFLRTEVLKKVGFFDERFFMYPEDIDLTRRIHQHYKTVFFPDAKVVHVHARGSYKNVWLFFIHIQNMIKYFNKWGWFFDKERKEVNRKILSQF